MFDPAICAKLTRRRPRDRWVALIPGSHGGYVKGEDFERIQKMIVGNRLSNCEPSGAAHRGIGLLVGVLRCRRCARMLRVYYKGPDGDVIRYACPKAHFDNKEARCIASAVASLTPRLPDNCFAWFSPRQ